MFVIHTLKGSRGSESLLVWYETYSKPSCCLKRILKYFVSRLLCYNAPQQLINAEDLFTQNLNAHLVPPVA